MSLKPDTFDLHQLIHTMKTAVIVVNEQMLVHFINDAGLNLLETGLSQIKDRSLSTVLLGDSIDFDKFTRALSHNEAFTEAELQFCFKDGRSVMVDLHATPLDHESDTFLLIEVLPIDKQRKISQETQQYAQQVAAKELIRGLAHEIKNPLGGIRGAAQLLGKELKDPSQAEFTQMIIDQSDRLRALVDRLLGPNSLPQKRMCNLHEIIEKVLTVISADIMFNIHVERDYDPSIPEIHADPDMIQQALLNIARNASQALKSAKATNPVIGFRTRIERQCVIKGKRHGLCALISIIDNGPGVPAELKDTLFYPMVTSKRKGSGLGLSIAQTLADHHQGKIDVESFPGYTEFTLHLPITIKDDTP
ncbi:nitrogen regulation protein NR(II) [Glaciecola sp. XM2]|uniref:nitrogen regulation protein NR(II) n=1 Tax=Glaciecola sp. XM2 TaxID=1914931 RepID=UPI001BDE11B6|nr:nitrogen regulation protein NR(II) [Glaciecola sp. XM2]MBT1450187.1 nitrogen regulation protein NR(II) [Glaciecola sp. XM2]